MLVYQIAREHLDPVNELILQVLYLMVHDNDEACSRLTRFTDTLALQWLRADRRMVKKLVRHVYKTASYLFNDRGSVMHTDEGLYQRLPSQFTITHLITKWMGKIDSIAHIDES